MHPSFVMAEQTTLTCPICKTGVLNVIRFPSARRELKSTLAGKGSFRVSHDRIVINDEFCPNCHASKKDIEAKLRGGSMSASAAAERAMKAGLPTKF